MEGSAGDWAWNPEGLVPSQLSSSPWPFGLLSFNDNILLFEVHVKQPATAINILPRAILRRLAWKPAKTDVTLSLNIVLCLAAIFAGPLWIHQPLSWTGHPVEIKIVFSLLYLHYFNVFQTFHTWQWTLSLQKHASLNFRSKTATCHLTIEITYDLIRLKAEPKFQFSKNNFGFFGC